MPRPYVLCSAAVSLDGYLDDASPQRLLLSGPEDFDRVDRLRADADAILVGAGTLRADDSRLVVRSAERRAARVARGAPEHPLKVAVSASGLLSPGLRFFHTGGDRLVYTAAAAAGRLAGTLDGRAEVVALGPLPDWAAVLDDLGARGVRRLLVEGGGTVHTALLAGGLADELRLAVAPLVVGDERAPRFLGPGRYPGERLRLVSTETVGDVAVLRLRCSDRVPDATAVTSR
jgi:5-amino-6-(5-phosphoribosylamino)uracil reductase